MILPRILSYQAEYERLFALIYNDNMPPSPLPLAKPPALRPVQITTIHMATPSELSHMADHIQTLSYVEMSALVDALLEDKAVKSFKKGV